MELFKSKASVCLCVHVRGCVCISHALTALYVAAKAPAVVKANEVASLAVFATVSAPAMSNAASSAASITAAVIKSTDEV